MARIFSGITAVENGGLSFGDYTAKEKIKVNDFENMGNIYNLRCHDLVTRLEKNGELLIETVPGSSIINFILNEKTCSFEIESSSAVQVTLGLAPETSYDLSIRTDLGSDTKKEINTNRVGKLSFSVTLSNEAKKVLLEKI